MKDNVTLLLVDDLEENLVAMAALLRGPGLRLLKARSGEEALELLLANEVAIALVDVQMPGMDGFELAELMRGSERTKHVPIVFVTAGAHDRKRMFRGYDSGAVDFLYKPIEPHILTNKVTVFVELFRQKQALARVSALQSAIFNSANFSSIATDAEGVIQIFNVGAERMLGYTAAEVMNKITPADISDPQEVIARAKALSVELGTPITPGFEALVFKASRGIEDIYELTYIRKDGSRFPAVVSVTALRDTQEAIIGYLLIGTDNTARKHVEEELLKAGALQSAIFNSANFSSIATDAKGVIQIFNVGAERMLGYTAAEVMNKITPADISDPQEVIARAEALSIELGTKIMPGFEALVFKASRGIEDIYELTYIRKDKSRFPAVVSVTALRDAQNTVIGYLLIGTDNTARKQVEEERKKLDQRLRDQQFYTRSLIESNIDALMTTDPQGFITDVNKEMEALTGCTRDELIGAPFKNYFTKPELAEAAIKQVLSERKVANYELTARARDGKETVVSYNAATFYDRDRSLQGVFAAARDITERKLAEVALLKAIDELRSAQRAAERASKAKDGFLAALSHELRTPLTPVLLAAAALREDERLPADAREQLGMMERNIALEARLIDDLLDLTKIAHGKLRFRSEPCDAHHLIGRSVEIVGDDARAKGIIIESTFAAQPSRLMADPARFQQVIWNLLRNAVKFTQQSGRISIRTREDKTTEGAIWLRIEVSDSGIGIDPARLEQIFLPFDQGGLTGDHRFGGVGLGLAIARAVVELHGGRISAQSAGVNCGATFVVELPCVVESPSGISDIVSPASAGSSLRQTLPPFAPLRLLLVEDHESTLQTLSRLLQRDGHRVVTATTVAEALDAAAGNPFDLVISDLGLPDGSGTELMEELRDTYGLRGIALSGYGTEEDTARSREAGFATHLVKPVAIADLRRAIISLASTDNLPVPVG